MSHAAPSMLDLVPLLGTVAGFGIITLAVLLWRR